MVETTHEALLRQTATAEELLAYFQGQRTELQADIATSQAAYAALAANLKGVVKSQMYFTALIDPDEANPTNEDAGVFNTIEAAVEAAPSGAFLRLSLQPGKTYPIEGTILAENRNIILQKSGAGDNPVLAPAAFSTGSSNALWCFRFEEGGSLKTSYVDVQFPQKADAGLAWSSDNTLVGYHPTMSVVLGMIGGVVTGHDNLALISSFTGRHVAISLNNVTLDGAMFAVKGAGDGSVLIGRHALTLTNGAQLTDGGTVGTNILQG